MEYRSEDSSLGKKGKINFLAFPTSAVAPGVREAGQAPSIHRVLLPGRDESQKQALGISSAPALSSPGISIDSCPAGQKKQSVATRHSGLRGPKGTGYQLVWDSEFYSKLL